LNDFAIRTVGDTIDEETIGVFTNELYRAIPHDKLGSTDVQAGQ
jgi:hypothetical protein